METKMPVPQLKLGPNGEIMLDEKSLVIETTGDKEARETLANADIVYDDEYSGSKYLGIVCIWNCNNIYCVHQLPGSTSAASGHATGRRRRPSDSIVVCTPSVQTFR